MHRHIVMFNFKDEVDEASRDDAIAKLRTLGQLPMVRDFMVEKNVLEKTPTRPFAWLILADFADQAARDAYEKDPLHVDVIKTQFVAKAANWAVLDVNT
jgi:hypothetical protein